MGFLLFFFPSCALRRFDHSLYAFGFVWISLYFCSSCFRIIRWILTISLHLESKFYHLNGNIEWLWTQRVLILPRLYRCFVMRLWRQLSCLKLPWQARKPELKKKSQALCPHAYNLSTLGSKDGRGPGLSGQAGLVSLAWNRPVRDPVSKQKWKTKQKHQLASRWVDEWYPRKNTWGCPPTRLPHMRTYTSG